MFCIKLFVELSTILKLQGGIFMGHKFVQQAMYFCLWISILIKIYVIFVLQTLHKMVSVD